MLCFVSFRFVSFRFVSFRFVSFRFVSFRFVSFRFVSSNIISPFWYMSFNSFVFLYTHYLVGSYVVWLQHDLEFFSK